jgi:hypothetical protein
MHCTRLWAEEGSCYRGGFDMVEEGTVQGYQTEVVYDEAECNVVSDMPKEGWEERTR